MKKTVVLINLVLGTVLVLTIGSFGFLLKSNLSLQTSLKQRKEELEKTKVLFAHLKQLKNNSESLLLKEESLHRKVPKAENKPMGLIKDIFNMASQLGIMKITFDIKETGAQNSQMNAGSGADGGGHGGPAEAGQGETAQQGNNQDGTGPKAVDINMSCQATFSQLKEFLSKLSNLERIVAVEDLQIKRNKDILPYQNITLKLVAYVF
jgi:Tfp pilus assembly protein PilO